MTDTPREQQGVTVRIEPDNTVKDVHARTVLQLLNRLSIRVGTALVIRDGGLLTPDVKLRRGDQVTVRIVTSAG